MSLEIDSLIAQDFNKLSFHDRNAVYEEIHGVKNLAPEESPESLADALNQLSLELAAIPHKPAFDRSQQWNSYRLQLSTLPKAYLAITKLRLRLELTQPTLTPQTLDSECYGANFSTLKRRPYDCAIT
mmetsp:Transcript_6846/g.6668  ORF Transcript_6846/g.6668 Transcript_6846/m.6668 type:complete len:128 (+) Transcript_6846:369-752(+)